MQQRPALRKPEAFATAHAALDHDPGFGDFQDIKASAAFKAWKKSAARTRVVWRHHFLEATTLAAQSSPTVLLAQALLESHPVLDPFNARPAPFDPKQSLVLKRIASLPGSARDELRELAAARDAASVPEIAEMDNVFGPDHAHQLVLEHLIRLR